MRVKLYHSIFTKIKPLWSKDISSKIDNFINGYYTLEGVDGNLKEVILLAMEEHQNLL